MEQNKESIGDAAPDISLTVASGGKDYIFHVEPSSKLEDLAMQIQRDLQIPISNQKFLISGYGLQKAPFHNYEIKLSGIKGKLILMGSTAAAVDSFQAASSFAVARRAAKVRAKGIRPTPRRSTNPADAMYTFMTIRPLAGLPHPEQSEAILDRLRDDPGIRFIMQKHKFSVGLLTEMEPIFNTQVTHEGVTRLLGLNRNQGEVIELRLRMDAHDGYRDYKSIRRTLCHELTHNVQGPHDRKFWDLCHQVEREVEANDWRSGGHSTGDSDGIGFSNRSSEELDHEDHGGWIGGQVVLGGSSSNGMSTRELLARAAEQRHKNPKDDSKES